LYGIDTAIPITDGTDKKPNFLTLRNVLGEWPVVIDGESLLPVENMKRRLSHT
jgi:hypothetical protein